MANKPESSFVLPAASRATARLPQEGSTNEGKVAKTNTSDNSDVFICMANDSKNRVLQRGIQCHAFTVSFLSIDTSPRLSRQTTERELCSGMTSEDAIAAVSQGGCGVLAPPASLVRVCAQADKRQTLERCGASQGVLRGWRVFEAHGHIVFTNLMVKRRIIRAETLKSKAARQVVQPRLFSPFFLFSTLLPTRTP